MKTFKVISIAMLFFILVNGFASAQGSTSGPGTQQPQNPLASTSIQSNTLYAVDLGPNSNLWTVYPVTGETVNVGATGYSLTDIAFDGETLYGVGFNMFFSLDPQTGAATVIGDTGFFYVTGLAVAADGTVFGVTY